MREQINAPKSDFPPKTDVLSFDDTAVAFASKTNTDLKKARFLFKVLSYPRIMTIGKHVTLLALKLRLPIKGLIKKTIFNQFCGGETISECADTTKILDAYRIGTILDYSVEGKHEEEDFDAATEELLRTIDTAHDNPNIPFCVFKFSGLCSHHILEKVSAGKTLTESEKKDFEKLHNRVERICKRAYDTGTPVFVDAEESWIQNAIDQVAMEMMERYNKDRVSVFNPIQLYRHDRFDYMKSMLEYAKEKGFIYAVKLVRGAYMEKERARAKERKYPDPIHREKASTDRDFDSAVLFCLDNLENMAMCSGTHNEASCIKLAKEIEQRDIGKQDKRVYFAQLFGMSDHVSFNLSKARFNVAKYVPYGPVEEVMPYLIRRAEENSSVAGQTNREVSLLNRELRRRNRDNLQPNSPELPESIQM
ncbi:MAG: proline dehydrogenase family protein [Cryomorphaceae bacterium]